ncbi:LpxL/LpxP family Kdo(2)-lipid IV(A) lauroyl/palmitoleoyl acyltransferase [Oceanicoccus sagamiensis]|uniref:Lipid A biosynthesis acyltransferase n=1 Tax=Oceanicoccus sagamiensis TaxID=716816 RepID=A0A1X9N887_9GAMM|nr:LpxL/LpxP family Kdo(2)-lipid IV(A) lauroyl/palmitoleoyl acyltransferase [Oceanicoccus sagamiensis]ARN73896.1 lipid A biosynthesis acyltransferase [Oceanicoccus sagamiensis]
MNRPADPQWTDFLAPAFWPTWLVLAVMRLVALLPFQLGLAVGSWLGSLLYRLATKRRRVTEVNIALCFKELSAQEQTRLVKDVFKANAIGLIETAWAYWGNPQSIEKRTTFVGFELLEQALKQEKGVVLLGGHFSTLDLGGLLFSFYGQAFDCVYRPHNNPLMDYWICKKRSRFTKVVDRKKFRELLRDMRKNRCIWYAPDQDFGSKGAVFVPFFGQPAATIVATSKMVRLNNSPILMLAHYRNKDNSGYTIECSAVPDFPSGDETNDALIVNQVLETAIRKAPEQYMWVHKRFKTQPDGNQKLYKAAGC